MPPDERDRTPDANLPLPLGDWESDAVAEAPASVAPPEATVFCQRCGETSVPVANCCPWCALWLVGDPPRVTPIHEIDDEPEDDWHTELADLPEVVPVVAPPAVHPLVVVFVSYFLLLASLFAVAVLAVIYGASTPDDMHDWMVGAEVIGAGITIVALGLVWRTAKQQTPAGTAGLTWIAAFPLLFALLCLNIAFITFLRELFRPFGVPDPPRMQMTIATILMICVQPAIVEELFFRQMTLGVFRRMMGLHLAVWVTAAMFAFAHLGQFLVMPYLFLVGGILGYARVYGGLTLAMLMHFVHNLVVVAYDAWK